MRRPSPPSVDPVAITGALVAVRQAADAICDRWSFEILLAAFEGETRFTAFVERAGMASRLVASRLMALEQLGVFERKAYSANPPREDYRLTPMGEALAEVIRQMLRWEHRWRPSDRPSLRALAGPLAGAEGSILRCRHCRAPTTARDVTLSFDPAQTPPFPLPAKAVVRRRSTLVAADRAEGFGALGESLDIFGDKWGIEILICGFFRVRRFGAFRACTGISTNVLSDRLARLEGLGVLSPARGRADPRGYWLTEKGLDLYGVTVAVQEWADAWLPNRTPSPVTLIHAACGRPFRILGEHHVSRNATGLSEPVDHKHPRRRTPLASTA
jgi:DNA-binding HxlR family transcriptional regulator